MHITDQMDTLEEIKKYLHGLEAEKLDSLMKAKDYTFDENESTSRNIWNFAEQILEQNKELDFN